MTEILEGQISPRKLKLLFMTNYPGMKSGFGAFIKELATYLYKTGKYDITVFASGTHWESKDFARYPWKTYGTLPNDPRELQSLQRDPNLARAANYGDYLVDKVIQTVKPDVFIGIEDPWGVEFCRKKKWWGKIPCVVHTTLDSRPILKMGIDLANSTPYFYSWADFATKDMHKLGLTHVKTLRGSVHAGVFRRLGDQKRSELRERAGIPQEAFCVGMLSRNQLRKSFPQLLRGYKMFKERNPEVKETRLLLYTHYSEGWNIPELIAELGINPAEILATYKCRATGRYYVMPFQGQDLDNPETGHKKSLITVNVQHGLTEEQVNEWYNLLDVYAHAFTSGGQERGIQEAKLAELITLVTNYSCGEDNCVDEAYSLPLDWEEYREPGSQFIKATTKPYSIAKQLEKVYKMDFVKRRDWGKKAREWVIKNFSIEVIGKQFEELFDSFSPTEYDFDFTETAKNPDAVIEPVEDNIEWIKSLYSKILLRETEDTEGVQYWLAQLNNGATRKQVEDYFRHVARTENEKSQGNTLDKILGPEAPEDRVLITMPESLGDCLHLTALLRDARELYPNKQIYVATKPAYVDVFYPLVGEYIDNVILWRPEFDNVYSLEGNGGNKKVFQIILQAHALTQRLANYIHNADDSSKINLTYPTKRNRIVYGDPERHEVYVGPRLTQ